MLGKIWGERLGRGTSRRVLAARRGHRPVIEGLEERIALTAGVTDVWQGPNNGVWSNPANWSNGQPTNGDDLVFPSTLSGTSTNDLTGLTINSITIGGPGYTLAGNTLSLTAGITASFATPGTSTYNLVTTLLDPTTPITVATNDTLDIPGVLSNPISTTSGVELSGGGTVDISSVSKYTGPTVVGTGTTLQVDGTIGPVQLQGGLLVGNGTVGTLTSVGGTISPGLAPAVGSRSVTQTSVSTGSNVTLDSASTFQTVLTSVSGTPTASELTQSSPTTPGQTINLGGAKLSATLAGGYAPAFGDTLTIISNGTGVPVNGVFAGLPEGAAVGAGNYIFRISYVGGATGRDVVLTNVAGRSTTTLQAFPSPSYVYGQTIPLTATVTGSNGTATGTVEFLDGNPSSGGKVIATAPLNNGIATTTVSYLGVLGSPHQIFAVYLPTPSSTTYAGSTSSPQSVSVTPATLTVSGVVAENKQYDATAKATVDTSGATLNGVLNGDNVQLQTLNAAAAFASAGAGTNIPVTVSGLSLLGPASPDYVLQQPSGLTANITPAPLLLVANDLTSTAGSPLPALTYTAVGLQGTDTVASLTTQPTLATSASSTSPPGTYPIFITGGSSPNYTITDQNGTLTLVVSYATTTTLTSSNQVAVPGEPVTFTATVTAASSGLGTPTGNVAFIADGSLLGLVPLNASTGQAALTTSSLAFGTHTINALYLSNSSFQNSTSAPLTQYVSAAGTNPTLTIVPIRIGHRRVRKFELIAQVLPDAPATGTPTGTVTFYVNAQAFYRTVDLTNGTAVLDVLGPRLVNKFVFASYNGTQAYIGSSSLNAYVSRRALLALERTAPAGSLPLALRVAHPTHHRGR